MTPRLILLTSEAAADVAEVFRADGVLFAQWGINCTKRPLTGKEPFEVRDYLAAPLAISDDFCGARTVTPEGIAAAAHRAEGMARAIRALPGGEEWLVGLVLPAPRFCSFGGGQEYCAYRNALPLDPRWACEYCRRKSTLPARLAILAPEPPPLLVERVRAWGGEMWHCYNETETQDGRPCSIYNQSWPDEPRDAATWPEAVRAALGEAL